MQNLSKRASSRFYFLIIFWRWQHFLKIRNVTMSFDHEKEFLCLGRILAEVIWILGWFKQIHILPHFNTSFMTKSGYKNSSSVQDGTLLSPRYCVLPDREGRAPYSHAQIKTKKKSVKWLFTRFPIYNVLGCFPCVQVTSHLKCIGSVSVRSSVSCINMGVRIELTKSLIGRKIG